MLCALDLCTLFVCSPSLSLSTFCFWVYFLGSFELVFLFFLFYFCFFFDPYAKNKTNIRIVCVCVCVCKNPEIM